MRSQALDAFGIGIAICNPLTGGQVAVSESMGAAICSAVNDWISEHWLDQEPRLRASIVVPAQAPLLAAEEIERCAGDHRFVQVLLPAACEMMLGRSYYWPIYEAAVAPRPAGRHSCRQHVSLRARPPPAGRRTICTTTSPQSQMFEDQLLSLISNGVFNKFPDLQFVLLESGVTWLPGFIWRAIKTWRGVRAEVPWVNRSPAEIIRDNIRLTHAAVRRAGSRCRRAHRRADRRRPDAAVRLRLSALAVRGRRDHPAWPVRLRCNARSRVDNPLATYPRLKETVQ